MSNFTNDDRETLTKCATLLEAHLPRLDKHEDKIDKLEKNQVRLITLASAASAGIAATISKYFSS